MIWLFFVTVSSLAIVDRWLKYMAVNGVVREFGSVQFVLFKNDNLVFSWPAPNGVASMLMMIAIAAVLVVVWRLWQRPKSMAFFGSVLLLIGALSNLYDRLAYGFVIDFAYLGRWWPVFNVADMLIGLGLVLLLWRRRRLTSGSE